MLNNKISKLEIKLIPCQRAGPCWQCFGQQMPLLVESLEYVKGKLGNPSMQTPKTAQK